MKKLIALMLIIQMVVLTGCCCKCGKKAQEPAQPEQTQQAE